MQNFVTFVCTVIVVLLVMIVLLSPGFEGHYAGPKVIP